MMRTENKDQAQQVRLSEGMRLIFDQGTSVSPISRASSRSSSSCSSSSDRSCTSTDSSRASSRTRRSRHGRYHSRSNGSSSSSSSHSRSRSRSRSHSRPRPRCHRAPYDSRCCRRHRLGSNSPSRRRSSFSGRRRYSRSDSRSSSRGRYYRKSRRSRSRSSTHGRLSRGFVGRFRYRFSPSPKRSYYRSRSRSPDHSVRLSQRENAAKLLGVEKVELPASLRFMEREERKPKSNTESGIEVEPVLPMKPTQDEAEANTDDGTFPALSPTRKQIAFSVSNTVAKPSTSPTAEIE